MSAEQGKPRGRPPAKREPWHPAEWSVEDAGALQALQRGEARPDQQQRALKWIIEQASQTYDQPFVPGQADVSDFICGRMSVGQQIRKLLVLNLALFKSKPSRNTEQP